LKAIAFNVGYNFKNVIGIPISFGFGYANSEFDYGFNFIIEPPSEPDIDSYNAYSFGLEVDYYVLLNAGFTIKDITSIIHFYGEGGEIKAEKTVNDFGILLIVPVLKLIDDKMQLLLDQSLSAKPTFNFSLGYSKSNIGDSIYYIDPLQSDPLPRVERLGYGISTGFDLVTDDFNINAFNISFTVEAEDILVSRSWNSINNWEYQDDLDFWENVILIKGNEKVVSRVGTKFDFAETFAYAFGHFSGRGYGQRKTNGYEFRLKGLLKVAALWAKHPVTDFLRDHFDIRYYNTNYFADHEFETKMTGLAFYVHNLNELFE
jgi:hypothetical protein